MSEPGRRWGLGGGSDGDAESERDTAAPQGRVSCDRERWSLPSLLPPPSFSSLITFEICYFSWRRSKEKYQRRPPTQLLADPLILISD